MKINCTLPSVIYDFCSTCVYIQIAKEEQEKRFWREKVGATVQQINSYATYAEEMKLDQDNTQSEADEEEEKSGMDLLHICLTPQAVLCRRVDYSLVGRWTCSVIN